MPNEPDLRESAKPSVATVRPDADAASRHSGLRILFALAAFVIVVAGMRAAAELIVPFLLAMFVAILSALPLAWLRKRGVPHWLTLPAVLLGMTLIMFVLSAVIAGAINQFVRNWDSVYDPRAEAMTRYWNDKIELWIGNKQWLGDFSVGDISSLWSTWTNPDNLMQRFVGALRAAGGVFSQGVMILITAIFLIADAANLPQKVRAMSQNADERIDQLGRIVSEIHRYLAIKTWTSLLTGVLIAVGLRLLEVEFALLWGLLAFLLNYVPNIGSILAAVPAVMMTLLQAEGRLGLPLAAATLYVVVNALIGYVIEPRWMGRGLGLSTLVVFLSLVFWGWVLGPVGMLICVPLTMAVKIALESNQDARWIAILMGGEPTTDVLENDRRFAMTGIANAQDHSAQGGKIPGK